MGLGFHKYQGLGNDFILLDNRQQSDLLLTPAQVQRWCDRHFGIGADGVIFLLPAQGQGDYQMRIVNSDGSEPEMCGNGIRCLAQFIRDLGDPRGDLVIETLAGLMKPSFTPEGLIRVDMGLPKLLASEIPTTLAEGKVVNHPLLVAGQEWLVTCVSMGNPHAVVFVEDVAGIPLAQVGPLFEHHPAFPQRVNTEFVQVLDRQRLKMRVWERGAGATLACGTGACASLVAGVLTGQTDRQATVQLPGGDLQIAWDPQTNHVWMTGSASLVFVGAWCGS
ncbi:MAG: diaminopimelate epimerase [Thermostichales cyanobacterium DRC_bins_46]